MFDYQAFEERAATMGLQSYELARADLEAIVARIGLTMMCAPLLARSRMAWEKASEWDKTAVHRQCRMNTPRRFEEGERIGLHALASGRTIPETSYICEYSVGSGIPLAWGKTARPWRQFVMQAERATGPNWASRAGHADLVKRICDAWNPSVVDVVSSILMDSPDGENFADWCADIGFDPDSRSAERSFNLCCEGGAWARVAFGLEFETARELARMF